jgi:NADPH-dependent 2,4-dienoyl-CoA reductase/sulfur reductase-like enzyme
MEQTNVLIIGGSAAGLVTAQVAKSYYPDKEVLVVRDDERALIPCAIPYMFGTIDGTDNNILPDKLATGAGANVLIDTVTSVDRQKKICHTAAGKQIQYEKLVIATGSTPRVPKWLKGAELGNVFTVPKAKAYLDAMLTCVKNSARIVVVGAGFIGVELADQLARMGKEVTLVELLPHVLGLAFDEPIAIEAEVLLSEAGVSIKTGTGVKELRGNGSVSEVVLDNGDCVAADAVVLAMGYEPNSRLAREAGLEINSMGSVVVDEYMRTSDPVVFAVGDCAQKRDFVTKKPSAVMLASTACAEARVAAMSLYRLCAYKTFGGTLAVYSTALDGTGFGTAGVTERSAQAEGFEVVTGSFTGVDRHPGTLAQAHKQTVRLVVSRGSGLIIGGGVIGGTSAGELTNVLGLVIQNRMTVSSLLTAQIGTQPCLTASPAAYPMIKAAEDAARKL